VTEGGLVSPLFFACNCKKKLEYGFNFALQCAASRAHCVVGKKIMEGSMFEIFREDFFETGFMRFGSFNGWRDDLNAPDFMPAGGMSSSWCDQIIFMRA
jgi:hypothetical protein